MEQTLVEQVQESVLLEYLDFKEKELQKSKEEIFKDYYEIHFYEELSNFISCGEDILGYPEIRWYIERLFNELMAEAEEKN